MTAAEHPVLLTWIAAAFALGFAPIAARAALLVARYLIDGVRRLARIWWMRRGSSQPWGGWPR